MARYRRGSVVVEAEQWFPGRKISGVRENPQNSGNNPFMPCGMVQTLEGPRIVSAGDYIITGIEGEKHLCKPGIFETTFEEVAEEVA